MTGVSLEGTGKRFGETARQFVPIKPGTFIMGADLPADYITAKKGIFIQDELPARQVTITYNYEISKYEVTNAQYERYEPKHAALRGKAVGIGQDADGVVRCSQERIGGKLTIRALPRRSDEKLRDMVDRVEFHD